MLILAINTASSTTAIAILENTSKSDPKILFENSWKSSNDEAEKLMPRIDELLQKTGKTYNEIKKIIVIKGPGSFTGLRVGVTVANTIAYLNKCDIQGIDTFEYWWSKNQEKSDDSRCALLIYAGSKGVYVNKNKKTENVNLSELNDYLKTRNINEVFGDITEDQKNEIKDIKFSYINETFGETILKLTKNTPESTSTDYIKIIEPNYIKSPSITEAKPTF